MPCSYFGCLSAADPARLLTGKLRATATGLSARTYRRHSRQSGCWHAVRRQREAFAAHCEGLCGSLAGSLDFVYQHVFHSHRHGEGPCNRVLACLALASTL